MLMLVGCGSVPEVEPAAVAESVAVASTTISSAAQTTIATATLTAVPATSTAVPATSTTVSPTDTPSLSENPTEAAPAVLAAKPQFLEFYTEW